jgi:hypothetical protein
LEKVEVKIDAVKKKKKKDFEEIEIMDDLDPCSYLLGIIWVFDNNVILNLKEMHISFETNTLFIIYPLDPTKGDKCNEPINEYE